MPRAAILRRRSDFELVKSKGKRVAGAGLVLNWIRNPESDRRFAVIAPKAIGGAVVRNLLKRRVREVYRRTQHDLPQDLWSVWILRRGADKATFAKLGEEIRKLYRKARLLDLETKSDS